MRFLIAFLVVGLQAAHAAPADGIVIESYTGTRPEDANRLLSPVLEELASRGYVAGADVVGRRFEQRVSRTSLVEGGLPDAFGDQVEKGHKAWIAGRFTEAVTLLTPLVDAAHANPGAFAQNQPLREKLLKALIALALSHQRSNRADLAKKTFGEILRSFPDTQLSRASYGPEAFNLFEEVKKELNASGKGKLAIKADTGAAVFINERFQNDGGNARLDVMPGEYRVFVRVGNQLSRVHRVDVFAGGDETVTIDTVFDMHVHSSPKWTGFQFLDAASRERSESIYAAMFANAINARGLVVVGIDNVKGKPALVGSTVNLMDGSVIRRASVALDPDPPVEKLRAFGRFLAGDNAAPGIDIQLAGDINAAPKGGNGQGVQIGDRKPSSGGLWGGWKWITGVAGIAAMGVGAYYLSVDGDCADDACTYYRETSIGGWAALGGGAALAGISVYLFVRGSGESSSSTAFVVPAQGGAYAGYSLRF